jgi:hypothetical protein
MKKQFKIPSLSPQIPSTRQSLRLPSRVTPGGDTALKAAKVYTGNQVVGISIIHKSCLQPIFSKQEAVDAASMRR